MQQSYIEKTSGIKARDKIGYAMGDLASCLVFGLTQSVLNKYYTDVLEISVLNVMIMFIVARIWDAINDPIWGRLIDRAKPAADGRYRRWIKIFALPVAVSAVLMFLDVRGFSPTGKIVWIYVTYILFGMLYTCINIPYGSLAQVITSNDKERSSLSVFRSIGSTFGAMPAMALASFCYVEIAKDVKVMDQNRVFFGAALIAVLSVAAYMLCYRWSKERVESRPEPKQKGQTMKVVRTLLKSRPFMAVSLASMLFLAAQMFGQGYNSYLFHHFFKQPGLTMLPTVFQYLPVAVIMFFASKLGNRFGRREVCSYGVLLAAVFYLALFVLAIFGVTNVWLYLIANLMAGIGTAFIFLLVWVLASDAIDYNKVTYGLSDEATSYAFYSFMRKLGQTVAVILINVPLLTIGYNGSELKTEGLTPEKLQSMYNSSVMIPAVLFLLVFLILRFFYPLDKKAVNELQENKNALLK
ncbi:MAG: glycoside-pentoside-hexuronide (GPH):cation symporter [Oscillospiraceae bacterium]|nr:glycoside-pentoside-hexuronide (GPH):cation symporter [Oscillospiraceae bacterium]